MSEGIISILLFIHVCLGSKLCPSLLIILVSESHLVNSDTFPFPVACDIARPSAGSATAANLVCGDIDIFSKEISSLAQTQRKQQVAY